MLLAVDLLVRHPGEDFIDEEGITVSAMLSLQSSSVYSSKFDAPEPNALSGQGLARAERVSNPCHIKRSMRISRTTLTYSLHLKAYETYWLGQLSVCT
jgi:hypothetical protein